MKIIPIAFNHCLIELDNGEILDFNDGSSVPKGEIVISLKTPTKRTMIVSTSTVYDGAVRLQLRDIE